MDQVRRNFIIGFIKGYVTSSLDHFNKRDGKNLVKRISFLNYEKIQKLAELNAIHALLYDREYNGENFTLGDILEALNKTPEQEREIRENLPKVRRIKND